MSDPTFVAIVREMAERFEAITVADGYHLPLGEKVQIEGVGPVDLTDDGQPLPGNIVIAPGAASSSIGEGDDDRTVRMHVFPREAIYEREVRAIIAHPITNPDGWLTVAEQIGEDIRRAIYQNENAWMDLHVQAIGQTQLEAQRPEPGSRALMVAVTFTIRYHQ